MTGQRHDQIEEVVNQSSLMYTGSFLPTTVGAVGVVVLIVNLLTDGTSP